MSPAPEPTSVRVGARYRLDERIGAGAMGAVWRSTDELLNRTVAVKELLKAAAPPTAAGKDELEESRQRILREGRIGARLQHPHVISMFDVVVHDDRPWLVMEYLPSRSLAQMLGESGPLPLLEVADIGRQVADGLAAAHAAGVVHRDVKPGNVLIAEDGRVKLTDFGVSRAVDDVQLTRTGLIAGTPAFLSPEVARGLDPTAASDVFALGATLYAAVDGRPPFGLDDNAYALLHKVATESVRPPRQSGPVVDVIMRLLSREPDDRPSAAEARDAMAAAAAGRSTGMTTPASTTATAAGAPAPPRKPARAKPSTVLNLSRSAVGRRIRRLPVLLGVLGVLAVGAVITAAILSDQAGGTEPGGRPAAQASTSAPAPAPGPGTDPAAPTEAPTTAPQTSAAAPPTATSAAPSPTGESGGAVAFVQSYYGLLPGDTDEAWEMLGPEARAASGDRAGFEDFYARLESVSLQNARQTEENTVEATVVFNPREGATTTEPYRFVLGTGPGGQMIVESFSAL